jgi:tetratricopeptide (TPR) repeat protein
MRGEWDEAERGAQRVALEFDGNQFRYAAEAWYVVGEARRLRGDPTAAEAYHEAHARGRDPQPGRALLRLHQGDPVGAAMSVRSALAAAGSDPLRRAPICAAAVEIALAAGRLEDAADAESELATTAAKYATSGLEAMAATARGAMLVAEGRTEEALPALRRAHRHWVDLGAEYDAAGTCRWLARAYRAFGDEVSAAAELARAEETYERLGVQRSVPRDRRGAVHQRAHRGPPPDQHLPEDRGHQPDRGRPLRGRPRDHHLPLRKGRLRKTT